jgi:hypothetical protein
MTWDLDVEDPRAWLRAAVTGRPKRVQFGELDLAMATGQDWRALIAIGHCWELYASADDPGREAALQSVRELLSGGMQPKCWIFARELIARAMDWGDRDRVWALVKPTEQSRAKPAKVSKRDQRMFDLVELLRQSPGQEQCENLRHYLACEFPDAPSAIRACIHGILTFSLVLQTTTDPPVPSKTVIEATQIVLELLGESLAELWASPP